MQKRIGVVSRGICTSIIKQGDNLVEIITDSLIAASKYEGFEFNDRDVVGVTESILARSQGNYATMTQIAADVKAKFLSNESDGNTDNTIGITLPILSRNRFSHLLKAISMSDENLKLYILLGYPSDEVGNPLISIDTLDEKGVNPYTDVFTADKFISLFGKPVHPFTGIDYIEYYRKITGNKAEIMIGNDPREILKYTKNVICADIHTRFRSKRLLKAAGAINVIGLDDILNSSVDGSGFHPEYGLLGSNLATDDSVKLFPRDSREFAETLNKRLSELTGKNIEVLVYGDGAFKDPVGGIWELADPVVSPGFTKGLAGTPNEVKIKYLADNVNDNEDVIKEIIKRNKKLSDDTHIQSDTNISLGTTPIRLTDLLGSLCDLTSGSGDKGTPVVLIQGYFDNYADI
jgi:F420-0:gamma-glutamyl ligase